MVIDDSCRDIVNYESALALANGCGRHRNDSCERSVAVNGLRSAMLTDGK